MLVSEYQHLGFLLLYTESMAPAQNCKNFLKQEPEKKKKNLSPVVLAMRDQGKPSPSHLTCILPDAGNNLVCNVVL